MGATGFMGTHLVKWLAQAEHELYCLARKTRISYFWPVQFWGEARHRT